jgi:hypothetical protein
MIIFYSFLIIFFYILYSSLNSIFDKEELMNDFYVRIIFYVTTFIAILVSHSLTTNIFYLVLWVYHRTW